ncbi:MAG TPA: SGNH/GDSL hydrolase family protein [Pyrinomonadaceae bacterium]|nr:SGNH/GDSL hydrolase family protein [Pyrinomonadaceae bacterium]
MESLPARCLNVALLVMFGFAAATNAQTPTDPSSTSDCAQMPALKQQLERAENRLKDWPQTARYRDANAGVTAPAKNETRVVFMGDSITDLWDDKGYGGFFPGKPYVNRGIGGQTTPQMLIRFRRDVLALQPKAVVILAGTNDIAGNTGTVTPEFIQDNIATMAELARLHGIRVVLASLLPVSDYERNKEGKPITQTTRRPPAQIKALNEWIKNYAAQNNHTYLDYYSAMKDDKEMLKDDLSDDGLHANAAGYAVMVPLAEQAISAALKERK